MNKPYHHYKRRQTGNDPVGDFFRILFAPLKHLFSRQKTNYRFINSKWQQIQNHIKENTDSGNKSAVIEADKLFDYILQNLGMKGKNMGERLRSARSKLSNYSEIWQAHIIRNKIVHETDFHLSSADAQKAIRNYKKASYNLNK